MNKKDQKLLREFLLHAADDAEYPLIYEDIDTIDRLEAIVKFINNAAGGMKLATLPIQRKAKNSI